MSRPYIPNKGFPPPTPNKSRDHIVIALDHLRRARLKAEKELTPDSFFQWVILHESAVNKLKGVLELYPEEKEKPE